MKKRGLLIVLSIVFVLSAVFAFVGCASAGEGDEDSSGNVAVNGTYYLYKRDSLDRSVYLKISGSSWSGSTGDSGKCRVSDTQVEFYGEAFGEQILVAKGTVSGGVLTIINRTSAGIEKIYYCKEGYTPPKDGDEGGNPGEDISGEDKVTVTYNANGGEFSDGASTYTQNNIEVGSTLTAPAQPTRTNYAFGGWAKNSNGTGKWAFATDEVQDTLTLYAVWIEESAKIFSVDGANISEDNIFMLVDHNTDSVSLSNKIVCSTDSTWKLYYDKLGQTEIPTKIAAQFGGVLNNGHNIFYVVVTSQDGTQVNVYTLTIHRSYSVPVRYYSGTEVIQSDNVYTGDVYYANYTPNIEGYTFNYWKTENGTKYTPTEIYGPLALVADRTANTYTVTLDVNGGDALTNNQKTVTYDSNFNFAVPTRTGYDFIGWYINDNKVTDKNGRSLSVWNYANNIKLTSKWQDENIKYYEYEEEDNPVVITGVKNKSAVSLIVPESILEIRAGAFAGCSKLESLILPFIGEKRKTPSETYQYPLGYIFGTNSYSGGTATTQCYYGNSLSSLTSNTYYIPTSLRNVTIAGGNVVLFGSFYNCTGLTSIIIPNSVTSIGSCAFWGCSNIENIYYTGDIAGWVSISGLSNLMHYGKTSKNLYIGGVLLENNLVIPNSVTSIGDYAFHGCAELKSVTIPDSVTSIGSEAFYGCTGLTSITIPDSITSIGYYAFYGCTGLTSVTIPNSVTSIDERAFSGCSKLNSVYYVGTAEKWKSVSIGYSNSPLTNATKYYYIESQPTSSGNYWHYDADGITPVIW